jgi:hypothetical protein
MLQVGSTRIDEEEEEEEGYTTQKILVCSQ